MEMVTQTRMDAAKEMLLSTRESVKFIAQTVGFAEPGYFIKVFRKQVGQTPRQYRDSRGEGNVMP